MKPNKGTQVPGEEQTRKAVEVPEGEDAAELPGKAGTTALNNIAGKTANDVGLDREEAVRGMALAVASAGGKTADLAPPAAIGGDVSKKVKPRTIVIDGEEVQVIVPERPNVSQDVQRYGPESRLASGTPVRQDGSPCNTGETPYGVIGDIQTAHGKLVRRVIPLAALEAGAPS
jgi:hypothetical protein